MFTLLFQVTLDYEYLRMCISLQGDPEPSEGRGWVLFILELPQAGPSTAHVTKRCSVNVGSTEAMEVCVAHWGLDSEQITFHWFSVLASVKWEVKLGDF